MASHSSVFAWRIPQTEEPGRLLHPWDFPGKGTGVGCHFLLQGIFPTQELNPGLPHCMQTQADTLTSEPPGSPVYLYLYLYLYVCMYREGEKERIAVMCFFSLLQVINKILDMCSYLKDYYQPKCPTVIFNF